MVVTITDIVKIPLSVADISAEPIIGTPLYNIHTYIATYMNVESKSQAFLCISYIS